jgi:hypothetical protein
MITSCAALSGLVNGLVVSDMQNPCWLYENLQHTTEPEVDKRQA